MKLISSPSKRNKRSEVERRSGERRRSKTKMRLKEERRSNADRRSEKERRLEVQKKTKAQRQPRKIVDSNERPDKKKSEAVGAIIAIALVVVISIAGFAGWYFWWSGLATFDYSIKPVVILDGQTVEAEDFIDSEHESMELVSAAFTDDYFETGAGLQGVPLTLTRGRRTVDTIADLHVMTAVNHVQHEFKAPGPDLKPVDLISNLDAAEGVYFDIRFLETPKPLEEYDVGEYTLSLILNGAPFDVKLIIADTTPPTADPVDVEMPIGSIVSPEDFVENVHDYSMPVEIEFVSAPDIFAPHDQEVEVRITDSFENSAVFKSNLIVQLNDEDPVFEGIDTIYSGVGNSIMYLKDVTAHDSFGRDLTDYIEIDSSGVNHNEIGTYEVVYRITDFTGNETVVEATVQIVRVDVDDVNSRVDRILEGILDDGMTQLEQVRAIHRWVRSNMSYASSRVEPANVYEGADRALRNRSGNCFNYYSISELLLTRAGIPNQPINRIPGTPTRHRWSLVNPDDLGWHHFDTTPVARMGFGGRTAFFTASEARNFTSRIQSTLGTRNFYTYNPDLYPEIVK